MRAKRKRMAIPERGRKSYFITCKAFVSRGKTAGLAIVRILKLTQDFYVRSVFVETQPYGVAHVSVALRVLVLSRRPDDSANRAALFDDGGRIRVVGT